jgi:hypothetical protein
MDLNVIATTTTKEAIPPIKNIHSEYSLQTHNCLYADLHRSVYQWKAPSNPCIQDSSCHLHLWTSEVSSEISELTCKGWQFRFWPDALPASAIREGASPASSGFFKPK